MRFALTAAILLALAFCPSPATAQTQAGAHYAALALEYPDQTRSGVGAFVVYSPARWPWIGADVGTTVFLSEAVGGRAWQLLAGPRVGGTVAGLGVFGRVRPGLIRYAERFLAPGIVCIAIFPTPESCLASATSVALDLGGTVEYSISPTAVLRLDLGDTLTRVERGEGRGTQWMHGLQFNAGLGWKF